MTVSGPFTKESYLSIHELVRGLSATSASDVEDTWLHINREVVNLQFLSPHGRIQPDDRPVLTGRHRQCFSASASPTCSTSFPCRSSRAAGLFQSADDQEKSCILSLFLADLFNCRFLTDVRNDTEWSCHSESSACFQSHPEGRVLPLV